MSPHLLVVGGSGFLGGATIAWANKSGLPVDATYLSNPPDDNDPNGASWHRCDVLDLDWLRSIVAYVEPTVVINTAYRQSGDDAVEICSTGAHNVAVAAAEVGARVVHLSTDLVFDGELGRPYREDDPRTPINDYGRAKAEAELLVKDAAADSIVVRTSLIYGSEDAPQEAMVRRAATQGDLSFFTSEIRNPVNVHGLADAIGRLALDDLTGILHVAGNERLNRLEFARLLAQSMGLNAEGLSGSPADPSLGPRSSNVALETAKAQRLGYGLAGPTELLTSR